MQTKLNPITHNTPYNFTLEKIIRSIIISISHRCRASSYPS
ncbi:hypothetical protein SBF1_4820010 [Candidatus Desulfosporosinus infrequens]|uniref:Uncharacterized protein n=1 Tax=Candidatus Desulfosporosinus infrequens TaxID=2043169 RepID=A0A2U3LF71_9FIRM|nr:hypothetical protein SBF1_4820010 [Candidatus Desulfosporosinus infrequens]